MRTLLPALALTLALAAPAQAATTSCSSKDLRYPFQPGGPKTFGVFHLLVTNGSCASAHNAAKAYKVEFFPNIYVIDAKGVIRHKHIRGEQLEKAVEELIKEAGGKN